MLCYCYGNVSDHFGPSAFNKFGFGFPCRLGNGKESSVIMIVPNFTYMIFGLTWSTCMEPKWVNSTKYACYSRAFSY